MNNQTNIYTMRNSLHNPLLIAHRGCQTVAPENSLPGFLYAAKIKIWAIETDVWMTKDKILVCNHDKTVDAMYNGSGEIKSMKINDIMKLRIKTGDNIDHYDSDELRMPRFSEYLSICRTYGCVPFIEIKGDVTEEVIRMVKEHGLENYCVVSSTNIEHLQIARSLSRTVFIHHIFSQENLFDELVKLDNAGLSLNITDYENVPKDTIKNAHHVGLKICLRAGDTVKAVKEMIQMGLDYIPTNRIFSI
jgi:glycerophosphoryl diester phosphodiesterase